MNGLNSMILAASGATRPFVGRGARLSEAGSHGVTPCPDEVHSICNCRGAYVHQVPLKMIKL